MMKLGIAMLILALISLALFATYYLHARIGYLVGSYFAYRRQRLRRKWWHHQRAHMQLHYFLQLSSQKLPLNALSTTLRWPKGESAYLMLNNIYFLEMEEQKAAVELLPKLMPSTTLLEHHAQPSKTHHQKNYLFISNHRLMIWQNQHDLSLYYQDLKEIVASLYCIEILTKNQQHYVIFHHRSYAIVNAYCHLCHFVREYEVQCRQHFS